MAKLNLNFHKNTEHRNPTKDEIVQIEGVAISVEAIIKTLAVYAEYTNDDSRDMGGICTSVCNALELLIKPVVEYLSNYAGDVSAPEETEGETV
jgi:hypothetical protein